MRQVAHGVAFFQDAERKRVLELMQYQCSAKRAAYQAIQRSAKGNVVKIAVKRNYMPLLNQRYISDAVSMAQQISQERALFGGRRNWRKLQVGDITKAEWQSLRNNQLYAIGDKSKSGNPNIRVAGNKILVNDPAKRGLWIEGQLYLPQKWFPDWACYAVQIIYRNGQFEVDISWDIEYTEEMFCNRGIIGVDTNPDGCAVSDIDENGNLLEHFYILMQRLQFARRDKRTNDIRLLAKEIVDFALFKQKKLCVEKLNFNAKKRGNYKKFRRMRSNFVWRQILEAIKARAARFGVPVIEVEPAFTTDLGTLKYKSMYSLSAHAAAALVIGRRGLGFKERQDFTVTTVGSKNQPQTLEGRRARIALSIKASTWLLGSGMFLKQRANQPKLAILTGSGLAAGLSSAIGLGGGHAKPPGESDSITGRIGET